MRSTYAVALFSAALLAAFPAAAPAQTLVGDVFTTSYTGWVDGVPNRAANWRLNLVEPTLMDTNNANPPTSGAATNSGVYESDVLIQDNFLAPASYDLTATMRTNDDDIIGLVWNYQDADNYFRVGIRTQAAGSFGGTQGVSVQKVVGGVLTQLNPSVVGPGAPTPITQAMINNRTPFNLKVAVNGPNYEVFFNDASILSGTDADLAADRKIGFQSWAQMSDTDEAPDPLFYGTEIDSVSVSQGATTLYSQSFGSRPAAWRQLVPTNAAGTSTATVAGSKEPLGNFGNDVNNPWIHQHSNGNVFATAGAANIDFMGPSVVIDEPGSSAFSDYHMRVGMGSIDNDGIGILLRVQDDNNFYRVTFHGDLAAIGTGRAPIGMSVQKVLNGVWSELYRDTPGSEPFIFTAATPAPTATSPGANPDSAGFPGFDVSAKAIGNTLAIQVTDHLGNVINYPLITDSADPLLTGTVGLHTWGNENSFFFGYGDGTTPLLTAIPEPSALALAALATLACAIKRKRA